MSWSLGGASFDKKDLGKREKLPESLMQATGHAPHEAEQVKAAWDAACTLAAVMPNAPHGYVVTLTGHGTADRHAAAGGDMDRISVTVVARTAAQEHA